MENNPKIQASTEIKRSFFSSLNPRENFKGFVASMVILLGILGVGAYTSGTSNPPADSGSTDTSFAPIANNTVVYGYWTDKNSQIGAVDLSSGKIYGLAALDLKIKKVTIMTPSSLIFINKTDDSDRGREIASYNFVTKATTPIFQADADFGIDDYVISPGKRYIANWEVQVPSGALGLIGGRSRVYTINIQNPTQKNLIYDESITEGVAMHYPISITDSGEVFLDGFIANAGTGWANGMSYSNVSGSEKQNIPSMSAGTYSSQPVASIDGRYIAFAGYDGTLGTGTTGGFRKEILNPNTIEVLDTVEVLNEATKPRIKLSNLSSENRYTGVFWDKSSNNIIFSLVSKDPSQNGFYLYDRGNSSYRKIGAPADDSVITSLSNTQFLTGKSDRSSTAIGNLGPKYSSTFGSIAVFDASASKTIPLNIGIPLVQYIGLLSSNYFSSSLAIGSLNDSTNKAENNQLQLQTFALKPDLAPKREERQSMPPISSPVCGGLDRDNCPACGRLTKQRCISLLGLPRNVSDNIAWDACRAEARKSLEESGVCYGSPLYLYGKEGTKVDIKVNTKITKPIPFSRGEYSVILGQNGQFSIGGKNYSSIDFNYAPAIEMPNLDYGRIVKSSEVNKVLEEYGQKLGLNSREINDLKNSVRFSSSYVMVSFYDDEISKKILPISFTPAPDMYRNIVFYFKELEFPLSIREPEFDSVPERKGLTAVEISHIVE
ncbi:MAG: hypothetical protein AAB521_03035 [Patescibacteria group bacterium]